MKFFIGILLIAATLGAPGTQPRRSPRIMGGELAAEAQFPYVISFQSIGLLGNYNHFCGGVIYSENVVITSGYCVYGEDYANPDGLIIVAGELNMTMESGFEQRVNVSQITLHENYNSSTLYNDISLLTLESPLTFSPSVGSLPLQSAEVPAGTLCTAAGWGYLDYHIEGTTDDLYFVEVPIVDTAVCNSNTSYHGDVNDETDICAGEAGKDTCTHDSGTGLVCDGLVTGLASWGFQCGQDGHPGVYTKMSMYKEWVETNAFKYD